MNPKFYRNVRSLLAALALALMVGCNESDEGEPADGDGGTADSTTPTDGGGSDRGVSDTRSDGGIGDLPPPADLAGCDASLTACDGQCVDTASDPNNCGQCGIACGFDEVCEEGNCQPEPDDCRLSGVSCPAGRYCDQGGGTCLLGCDHNDQCSANTHCDLSSHVCVCDSGHIICATGCCVGTWTEQVVKTTTELGMDEAQLILDGSDTPCIGFSENSLAPAATVWAGCQTGTTWALQQLLSTKNVSTSAINHGGDGQPVLAYVYNPAAWLEVWLGVHDGLAFAAIDHEMCPSPDFIAVASKGNGTVCTLCDGWDTVEYACQGSTPGEGVIATGYDLGSLQLELDSADTPHLLYPIAGEVIYARHDGTGWISEVVGVTTTYTPLFDLELDPQGAPAVAYNKKSSAGSTLMLARRSAGGTWNEEIALGANAFNPVLRFDPQGNAVIAYRNGSAVWIGRRQSVGWIHQAAGSWSGTPAMDVDSQGAIHLLVADGKQVIYVHD